MKDVTRAGYVYKVVFDIPEPHVVYVGSTVQSPRERFGHHATIQKRPTKLNQLIRKFGREHFSLEIIEWVADRRERFDREHYWTMQYKDVPDNCNQCIGTRRSAEMNEQARMTNYRNRDVVCENDGKVYCSCAQAARAYGLISNDISECCARHLRQTKGYYFRYADVDKQLYVNYWKSAGIIRNRHILCIETGVVYKNSVEASKVFGVLPGAILDCCQRKGILRKSKVHLVFEDEYAGLPKPATADSDSPLCETSSMQESTRTDGSQV